MRSGSRGTVRHIPVLRSVAPCHWLRSPLSPTSPGPLVRPSSNTTTARPVQNRSTGKLRPTSACSKSNGPNSNVRSRRATSAPLASEPSTSTGAAAAARKAPTVRSIVRTRSPSTVLTQRGRGSGRRVRTCCRRAATRATTATRTATAARRTTPRARHRMGQRPLDSRRCPVERERGR